MASQKDSSIPLRPGPGLATDLTAGEEAPSKNALKKAGKEKEKAEKAAKRQEQERQQREQAEASDTAKHLYGALTLPLEPSSPPQEFTELVDLYNAKEDQEVVVDVRIHNARGQSAKLAFLVLREDAHTIQAVIAEGGVNQISRPMVKWCTGLNTETIVRVKGLVKKPVEPVTSTSISNFELHVESVFVISSAAQQLPIQVKDCERPPPLGDEPTTSEEQSTDGTPIVSLYSRLNNRVLDARTAANNAIFKLESGVSNLFMEYMNKHNFTWIQSSKIAGAATEGGAGVFELKYFETKAYLTQSPQFFKQMAIAMDMKRVCEIGPVFRAENSNTHRHLTEVRSARTHCQNHETVCEPMLTNGTVHRT